MILSQGILSSSTPRFRRYHEGKFYSFSMKDVKKKIKQATKGKDPDFFANKHIPGDTETTKHFKWNDIDGFYDPKEWDPAPWGIEKIELNTMIADCSILTQNYILGVEKSTLGKITEYFFHASIFLFMLSFVLYFVFVYKEITLHIVLPLMLFCVITFVILKLIHRKTVISKEDYLNTLNDIIAFYNVTNLNQRKLDLVTGFDGAYVGLQKISEATMIPAMNFYQQNQGVRFDPYNDNLLDKVGGDEEVEEEKINWREKRKNDDGNANGDYKPLPG